MNEISTAGDLYAHLFEVEKDQRPSLSLPDNLSLLAKLKATTPHRYEELLAKLKANKVPRLRALEEDVMKLVRAADKNRSARERKKPQTDDDFERDEKSGAVIPTQKNIRKAIEMLGITLSYNAFARRPIIEGLEGFGPTLDDFAENRLWLQIDEQFRFRARKDFFHTVILDACLLNPFHPVCDYLDGLKWDGQSRLDTWLIEYCGVDDSPYARSVGRLMLIAAVRRVRKPGFKHDEMLVLESPEGFNKSTLLRVLAVNDDWFTDSLPLNVDDKRMIENATGKWIIEVSELQGMRKGDVGIIKAQLSRQHDRARLAYDRMSSEVARQFVFFGTVNPAEATGYLASLTGNRRFWPVEVQSIDIDAFKRDRDQLLAEAAVRESKGETTRLDPALWDAAVDQQKQREAPNPLYDALLPKIGNLEGVIFAEDVWELLGIPVERRAQHYEKLGRAMKDLGFERTKRRRKRGGKQVGAYVYGEESHRIAVERDFLKGDIIIRTVPMTEETEEASEDELDL